MASLSVCIAAWFVWIASILIEGWCLSTITSPLLVLQGSVLDCVRLYKVGSSSILLGSWLYTKGLIVVSEGYPSSILLSFSWICLCFIVFFLFESCTPCPSVIPASSNHLLCCSCLYRVDVERSGHQRLTPHQSGIRAALSTFNSSSTIKPKTQKEIPDQVWLIQSP